MRITNLTLRFRHQDMSCSGRDCYWLHWDMEDGTSGEAYYDMGGDHSHENVGRMLRGLAMGVERMFTTRKCA